ncbi:MAG: polyprenyl synthetase family protein [Chitinophagales bacterium]
MKNFEELSRAFIAYFNRSHFPEKPASLYQPAEYFLNLGGKRIRPVMCLMGNELFDEIHPNCWDIATAIELFHNFTLIHDDIMDKAPLRRGMPTLHEKFGQSNALLAGDVMLVAAYDSLNKISFPVIQKLIYLFNKTAKEVCEGQQMDMDYEKSGHVRLKEYLYMIELKTSVLLGASLKMGAIIGGAGEGNQDHLYAFGLNLGLAFQIQDDYLDAFGDPAKFGKQPGGDIVVNKQTFLFIKAMETGSKSQIKEMNELMHSEAPDKVDKMIRIFKDCGVDQQAHLLKEEYLAKAISHLENIAVLSNRKDPLMQLAKFLIQRES